MPGSFFYFTIMKEYLVSWIDVEGNIDFTVSNLGTTEDNLEYAKKIYDEELKNKMNTVVYMCEVIQSQQI